MRRREVIWSLTAATWPIAAGAQQTQHVYRVALFSAGPFPELPTLIASLQQLGWVEGKNIVFISRSAENRLERLSEVADELVRLQVDIIVTAGTLAPLAAKQATRTIPIVMASAGDPIGSGLVTNLARPAENVTGLSIMAPDLSAKRLELTKEVVPSLSRAAIIWNAANPGAHQVFRETQRAADALGITLHSIQVRGLDDFQSALGTAKQERAEALIVVEDPLTLQVREQITTFAASNSLPAIYGLREFALAGGLMAYGAFIPDLRHRAAGYVDKILRGAKPADLPIKQPTKFELVINLKTAKALGLTIPPTLLARADEVIE